MDYYTNYIKGRLFETGELESEQSQLQEELNVVAELIQQCVRGNAHVALDQEEYQTRGLVDFVIVFNKEDIRFTFKDGTEIKV